MTERAGDAELTLMEELRTRSWRFGIGERVAIPLGRSVQERITT